MTLPHGTYISDVHLQVSNLPEVSRFYTELGFVQKEGASLGPDGGAALLFLEHRPGIKKRNPQSPGLFHVAYRLPERRDLARVLHHLRKLGIRIDGAADHLVSEALYLSDPEGNGIELYWDKPRSEWRYSGDMVEMATLPLSFKSLMTEEEVETPWSGMPQGTTIGHIHLQVSDLAAAEAFYVNILGFAVTQRTYPGALFVSAGGYHHHVGLNTWNSRGSAPAAENSAGLLSFGISVPEISVLEGIQKEFEDAGMTPHLDQQEMLVRDHDHITIRITRAARNVPQPAQSSSTSPHQNHKEVS